MKFSLSTRWLLTACYSYANVYVNECFLAEIEYCHIILFTLLYDVKLLEKLNTLSLISRLLSKDFQINRVLFCRPVVKKENILSSRGSDHLPKIENGSDGLRLLKDCKD